MRVVDLHCDTILGIWLSELRGERLSLRDTADSEHPLHIDLKKMKAGDYLLQNFALFTDLQMTHGSWNTEDGEPAWAVPGAGAMAGNPAKKKPGADGGAGDLAGDLSEEIYIDPWHQVTEMLRVFREEMADNADLIRQAVTWEDIERNRKQGKMSAVLTIEEGGILQGDLRRLDFLRKAGVRMMTITWNYDNELGHPNRPPEGFLEDFSRFYQFGRGPDGGGKIAAAGASSGHSLPGGDGLTDFGREAVARMEELGILPDVSHLSDAGFWDVAETVRGPFVASHSNARALCGCSRNLTDDMIRTVAEHGGLIGLNYCPDFLEESAVMGGSFGSCAALARHARHIMDVGGREVLALGSDFDGIPHRNLEMEDASQVGKLADAMSRCGFTEEETERLFFRNVLRLYREVF